MIGKTTRVGLIGAGYIADWHSDAIKAATGADVTAVCDVSRTAAEALAMGLGAKVYTSVEDLLADDICDAVHILTPPNSHCDLALKCLAAGKHTLVEKPFALSVTETKKMAKAAQTAGCKIATGHNFLGLPSYDRLKTACTTGRLGRISSAEINWAFPLSPLRSGPYGIWLLRDPKNLLLELGPHLFAFAVDLFGDVDVTHLEMSKPVALPGNGTRDQVFRILAKAGHVEITFNISLVEVFDDRSVIVRGSSAKAHLNYAADTLIFSQENGADIILNPFLYQMSHSWQHLKEGCRNGARHLASLNRKSAYGQSFISTVQSFYDSVNTDADVNPKYSGASAIRVMQAIDQTIAMMPKHKKAPAKSTGTPNPTVLVIGGTGFIGRNLTRALVQSGHDVRVLSRGSTSPFADIANHVETYSCALSDAKGLQGAMTGIQTVFHLAKSMDTTWKGCLKNDVGVTETIAQAALDAQVTKFIYTGTIASYDMSDPLQIITETTSFGDDLSDRNLYARSKAECESRLMAMHRSKGLPLSIARPGIVIGQGGPLQHWGIGRWQGAGDVKIWGHGRNTLPFVWINDVSDGLIRMMNSDAAVGDTFNLIGDPMMSARDYFEAIHDQLGARIKVYPGSPMAMYLGDSIKYALKKYALRRHGVIWPSYKDWRSRSHYSQFRNSHSKNVLGWTPEANKSEFVRKAIAESNLFGF